MNCEAAKKKPISVVETERSIEEVENGKGFPESVHQKEFGDSSCTSRRVACGVTLGICLVTVGLSLGLGIYYWQDKGSLQGLATCGDCHCSYADSDLDTCPEKPPTYFSSAFLGKLQAIQPMYDLPTLECDPYQAGTCESAYPMAPDQDTEAVCAIHYYSLKHSCDSYWMVSYANRAAAEEAGAVVTHRGVCGLCSTLQDLVVYMKYTDLTTLGKVCGTRGLTARDNGVECFQEKLGMTRGCAQIWMANVRSTLHNCGGICFREELLKENFNGPAPTCALSECLQCDEDSSGDVFKAYAGRTRRRSGLISAIARPCGTIASEIRHDLPQSCNT